MGCTCSGAHKEAAQQPPNLPSVDSSELDPPGHDFVKAWEQHQAGQPLKHYMPRSKVQPHKCTACPDRVTHWMVCQLRSFLMYRLPPPLGLATSPSALPTVSQPRRASAALSWGVAVQMEQRHRVKVMLADVSEQVVTDLPAAMLTMPHRCIGTVGLREIRKTHSSASDNCSW